MTTSTPRPLTLGDLIETMADELGDRIAVASLERDYTFAEIDERATRMANLFVSLGVQPGDHIAVHSHNRIEWVDAFYGALKARAVPININYKYLKDELAYLYDNCDAVLAVVGPEYVDAVEEVRTDRLKHVLVMGEELDAAREAASPERKITGRSGDDTYVIYTGGTTGMPKGVVWRQEDLLRGALNASRMGAPFDSLEDLAEQAKANENPLILLACGPMMHGGSQWILGNAHVAGATVGLYTEKNFNPEKILDLVDHAKVVSLTFLGDAMGRPVAETIKANPGRWSLESLMAVSNGAAPLSLAVREQIREALPGRFLLDSYGASETGATGQGMDDGSSDGKARFGVGADVEVFDDEMKPAPVGVKGMLARSGNIPLGYYNDEAKTAATFKVVDGKRWVIPGDFAVREEDGSVVVLGRGSVTINTGGEKVHPEEVEAMLKKHDDVFDAVVVATPHERWGQQVTALVHRREDSDLTAEALTEWARTKISNYKVPKAIFFVDEVPRTPVAKVDYPASAKLAKELVEQQG